MKHLYRYSPSQTSLSDDRVNSRVAFVRGRHDIGLEDIRPFPLKPKIVYLAAQHLM